MKMKHQHNCPFKGLNATEQMAAMYFLSTVRKRVHGEEREARIAIAMTEKRPKDCPVSERLFQYMRCIAAMAELEQRGMTTKKIDKQLGAKS